MLSIIQKIETKCKAELASIVSSPLLSSNSALIPIRAINFCPSCTQIMQEVQWSLQKMYLGMSRRSALNARTSLSGLIDTAGHWKRRCAYCRISPSIASIACFVCFVQCQKMGEGETAVVIASGYWCSHWWSFKALSWYRKYRTLQLFWDQSKREIVHNQHLILFISLATCCITSIVVISSCNILTNTIKVYPEPWECHPLTVCRLLPRQ